MVDVGGESGGEGRVRGCQGGVDGLGGVREGGEEGGGREEGGKVLFSVGGSRQVRFSQILGAREGGGGAYDLYSRILGSHASPGSGMMGCCW